MHHQLRQNTAPTAVFYAGLSYSNVDYLRNGVIVQADGGRVGLFFSLEIRF